MEKPLHLPEGAFPIPKATRVGAICEALHQKRQRDIMPLQAFRCEIHVTTENKGQVFFTIYVEPEPLSGIGGVLVDVQEVAPLSGYVIGQLLPFS